MAWRYKLTACPPCFRPGHYFQVAFIYTATFLPPFPPLNTIILAFKETILLPARDTTDIIWVLGW